MATNEPTALEKGTDKPADSFVPKAGTPHAQGCVASYVHRLLQPHGMELCEEVRILKINWRCSFDMGFCINDRWCESTRPSPAGRTPHGPLARLLSPVPHMVHRISSAPSGGCTVWECTVCDPGARRSAPRLPCSRS